METAKTGVHSLIAIPIYAEANIASGGRGLKRSSAMMIF
jgi:hypothetical protein